MSKITKFINSEVARTFYALVFLFIVVYFMVIMQQVSDNRFLGSGEANKPLRDVGFEWFNFITSYSVPDIMVFSSLGIMLVGVTILSNSWRKRLIFWRRFIWVTGFLYLYRGFTIVSTTLPPPKECVPIYTSNFRDLLTRGSLMIVGADRSCTDNIYSGHTMILTTSLINWIIYGRFRVLKVYALLHAVAGYYTVIASHLHFTVDVLLAIFITYAIYIIYYSLVRSAVLKRFHAELGHTELDEHLNTNVQYQKIAHTPHILNRHLIPLITWMDGLDLRWKTIDLAGTLPITQRDREMSYAGDPMGI
ncbi:hypothetical protein K493DRAFT_304241 [Basidiobolus meristosporus CBS 931.73]|uniref:Sphingomyelin synthase-like domain-containing protein n=1 Tax=Basidiobolus meristosporus CBS 931.73 TaxID=1314790 RepID=A0A1Y1XZN8_9FUNG|nr:hypothetical protein K493DRAFT_304241 [Basidiobolus meristosporus CBS 931.73]|eukprot:ORX91223.1 hypothetical protein K493DRAFT_304241 [Basidiobolus meristosporus CBS 931.73]